LPFAAIKNNSACPKCFPKELEGRKWQQAGCKMTHGNILGYLSAWLVLTDHFTKVALMCTTV